jgi:hypothetical protein
MCFQCMILVCETYELWMNKFCTIIIIKSWDTKFVMQFHKDVWYNIQNVKDPNYVLLYYIKYI